MKRTLHPRLEECRRQHERVRERVRALADDLTLDQFNWRPAPDRWTVAQNIAHLTAVGREALDVTADMIRRGREEGITGSGPFRRSLFGRWLMRNVEPPYRVKSSTTGKYRPAPEPSFDDVLPDFMSMKDRCIEQIESADGLDLGRLKRTLIFFPSWLPRITLEQWFIFIAAHERRHLWQIEHIVDDPTFPDRPSRPLPP